MHHKGTHTKRPQYPQRDIKHPQNVRKWTTKPSNMTTNKMVKYQKDSKQPQGDTKQPQCDAKCPKRHTSQCTMTAKVQKQKGPQHHTRNKSKELGIRLRMMQNGCKEKQKSRTMLLSFLTLFSPSAWRVWADMFTRLPVDKGALSHLRTTAVKVKDDGSHRNRAACTGTSTKPTNALCSHLRTKKTIWWRWCVFVETRSDQSEAVTFFQRGCVWFLGWSLHSAADDEAPAEEISGCARP